MTASSYSWKDGRPVLPASAMTQPMRLTDWLLLGPFSLDCPGGLGQMQEAGYVDAIKEDPAGCQAPFRPTEGQVHPNPLLPEGVSCWERLAGAESYDLFERFPGYDAAIAYAACSRRVAGNYTIGDNQIARVAGVFTFAIYAAAADVRSGAGGEYCSV